LAFLKLFYSIEGTKLSQNDFGGFECRFLALLYQCSTDEQGNHFATFYLMNTSRNRNRWGVTGQALEEALPTLKGVSLGMGAGYKVDRHYPEGQTMDCGAFTTYEKPGAYALGTATITDEKTWQLMQQKKLGPTSVVIRSFRDTCSACNQNLSAIKDPFDSHRCLKEGDAYAKVESFQFKRVDFVDVPAYPQAVCSKWQKQQTLLRRLSCTRVSMHHKDAPLRSLNQT
jgi:hypothetical protein